MENVVMVHKKKQLIQWFLNNFALKRPEAAKILNLFLRRDSLLINSHFVENVRNLPNALIISAVDSVTVSFLCRINDVYYEDIDEIMAIMEFAPPDSLYVWLSFDRDLMCSVCQTVFEVKPEVNSELFYYQVVKEIEQEIGTRIKVREECKQGLLAEIDLALDCQDRENFYKLSERYKELIE